jgi:hypothetical protein
MKKTPFFAGVLLYFLFLGLVISLVTVAVLGIIYMNIPWGT